MTGLPISERDASVAAGSTYLARAKVNLTLKIVGRRCDGFHELESLVVFANKVADRLQARPSKQASLEVVGPFSSMLGEDNLVMRAMEKVAQMEPGVQLAQMVLEKNIPVAAGLGGGSADASAALRALHDLNSQLVENIDWQKVPLALGADVPVCMESRAAIMRGIGEQVDRIEGLPKLYAVLVNAQKSPPLDKTARVFSKLGACALEEPVGYHDEPALMSAVSRASPETVMLHLREFYNDLEAPAMMVMPEISEVKSALKKTAGCQLARLSGAGPTCFGLFFSKAAAENACAQIQKSEPSWWAVATELV